MDDKLIGPGSCLNAKEHSLFGISPEEAVGKLTVGYEGKMLDPAVVHPKHYNKGIECWDYTTSHGMCFLQGNVVKYVTRFRQKDGLKDLKKARQYLDKLIETVEAEGG